LAASGSEETALGIARLPDKLPLMDNMTITGSCLCGGVRFEITLPPLRFQYCHCKSCRKSSSTAHAANLFFLPENFRWLAGEELVLKYTDERENPGYMRWFCRTCGSAVPRLNRTAEFIVVQAGLLDGDPVARPERSIFWDERAVWYANLDSLPKLSEGLNSVIREHPH
jgi:hypothetical protein